MNEGVAASLFSANWLGQLPSRWESLPLKRAVRLIGGHTPSTGNEAYWNGSVPWFSPKDMKASVLVDSVDHVTRLAVDESGLHEIPAGTTLVVVRGMILAHTFPVCVTAVPSTINQDMKALVPDERIDPAFLPWLLRGAAPLLLSLTDQSAHGTMALRTDRFLSEQLPVPPLDEQLAIAAYLEAETKRIDKLIAAKRELRTALDEFARSTFLAEVTTLARLLPGEPGNGLPWIPIIPPTWTRCKVKHLVVHFDQGVSPQCESRPPDEGEWGVLKAGCINSGSFNPMESKALPPGIPTMPEVTVCEGDLIISRANTQNLVGRSAVATRDYPKLMLSDKLYRLKVDNNRCVPEFVRRIMWVPAVRRRIEERATGASPSMLNIDRRTILELDLVLPPVEDQLALLEKMEERASAIGELIKHVEQELELLVELRSSTITDAVFGRLDVRPN